MFKKYLLLLFFISLYYPYLAFAQDESVTFTTYYPSPYGDYNNLTTNNLIARENVTLATEPGSRVGIGTTATPGAKLEVSRDADYTAAGKEGQLRISGTTNNNYELMLGYDTIDNFGFITAAQYGTGWKNLALNPGGGNVGIGTTNPGYKLDVKTSGTSTFNTHWTASDGSSLGGVLEDGIGAGQIYIRDEAGNNDVLLNTNGASYFNSGNVGIGTTTPGNKLDIQATDGTSRILIRDGSSTRFYAGDDPGHGGFAQVYNDGGTLIHYLRTDGGASYFNGGNVGIGTTTPDAATLTVKGTIAFYNLAAGTSNSLCYNPDGGYGVLSSCSSDERLKQNITSLDGGMELSQMMKLNPASFDWNPQFSAGQLKQFGLIAQDVQKVWPNLVSTTSPTALTPDGTLSINLNGLYAPIIASIQELNARTSWITVTDDTATTSAPSPVLTLDVSTGNVGIGTTNPQNQLHVIGAIRQTFATSCGISADVNGVLTCTSDERLKNILGTYNRGLEAIKTIQPVHYSFKKESGLEGAFYGFTAQNVMQSIPEAVSIQSDGYYGLDDRVILSVAVNSIKELKSEKDAEITELKSRIVALEAKAK